MAAIMEPAVAVMDLESKSMLSTDEEEKIDETSIASNEDTENNSVASSAEEKSVIEDDSAVDAKSDKDEVTESSEEAKVEDDKCVEEAEVKIRKNRGPRKVAKPETPPSNGHSTGRERKKVERFSVPANPVKKEKNLAVDKPGKGQKLGDIPFIADMLNKTTQKNLLYLHQACFGGRAKQREIKRQLRIFSGFPFDSDSKEFQIRRATISKWETKTFKLMFSVLGLKNEHTKENFVTKLMEFCLNPEDSRQVPHTPKKSKAKKSGNKSKSKKSVSRKKESTGKSKKRKHDSDNSDAENEDEEKLDSAGGSDSDDAGSEPKAKRSKQASSKKITKQNESEEEDDKNDESLSESEPEVDSEDEKKNKPKKKPVIAKKGSASSKRKAPVQRKPKKIAKKPKSDSESDEQSDAESSGNYDITTISNHDLKKLVQGIVKKADLSTFSMKMVMGQVKEIFKVEQLDSEKKLFIRSMVDEILGKRKGD